MLTIATTISRPEMKERLLAYILKETKDIKNVDISIIDDKEPMQNVRQRRQRICELMKEHQKKVKGDYIIYLEDDTIPQRGAFKRLLDNIDGNSIVSTVEVNRWAFRNIGAWDITKVDKKGIYEMQSITINTPIREVDACGWYNFITRVEYFKLIPFEVSPNPDIGPDVWWTYRLREKIKKPIKVLNINCKHYISKDKFIYPDYVEVLNYQKDREPKWLQITD